MLGDEGERLLVFCCPFFLEVHGHVVVELCFTSHSLVLGISKSVLQRCLEHSFTTFIFLTIFNNLGTPCPIDFNIVYGGKKQVLILKQCANFLVAATFFCSSKGQKSA